MDICKQMDIIEGNDIWRANPNSCWYEQSLITNRIQELQQTKNSLVELMAILQSNGGIVRNSYGLLHEELYTQAMSGTKVLIDQYHSTLCTALNTVCDADDDTVDITQRLSFFNAMRHSHGKTALLLSGGAALGVYHIGVVKALLNNKVLPHILSGSSAGSIVCGMIGTRNNDECQRDLFHLKGTISKQHNGQVMLNFLQPLKTSSCKNSNVLSRWLDYFFASRKKGMLMDTQHFQLCCRVNIGTFTFQEAYNKTGRVLNIIVCPQNRSDPPRLLNYLTAPHVLVWSAAVASSSLPGIFSPNRLLVKDVHGKESYEEQYYIDGSLEADLPMQQLSEMFNVNHFIISQINPHAILLTTNNLLSNTTKTAFQKFLHGILHFWKKQVKVYLTNLIELIGGQRAAPIWDTRRGFASQLFTQEYEGRKHIDISLIPWASHQSLSSAFRHCICNPSQEEYSEWLKAAERETWRYIPKIKSHLAEEITLDKCVQRLREKLLWVKHQQKSMINHLPIDSSIPTPTNPRFIHRNFLLNGEQSHYHLLQQKQQTQYSLVSLSRLHNRNE